MPRKHHHISRANPNLHLTSTHGLKPPNTLFYGPSCRDFAKLTMKELSKYEKLKNAIKARPNYCTVHNIVETMWPATWHKATVTRRRKGVRVMAGPPTSHQYCSTRPATLRAFCMRARSWNCLRERRRTCLRNASRSMTPRLSASPR